MSLESLHLWIFYIFFCTFATNAISQCPAHFCPPLSRFPTPHIWLCSVNHASQIVPWSQSTLKWWKWIKLITDSQCESWRGIKSCVWPTAAHPSAVLYDGENLVRFPSPFTSQSPSIHHTYRHPHFPYSECTLCCQTCNCFYPSGGRVFSCGVWATGVIEVLVSGVANVVVVINQTSYYFLFLIKHPLPLSLELGTNYFSH